MGRRVPMVLICVLVVNPALWAQEKALEFSPFIGYTFSEGIDVNAADIGNGVMVNKLTPKNGISYGFQVDFLAVSNLAIGFQFSQQLSKLEAGIQTGEKRDLTEMKVRNYHAMFTYNLEEEGEPLKPFVFAGLGATQYSPDDIMRNNIDSSNRFSTTWGGGVKAYASEHVGFRFTIRWTPTYISSSPSGMWCSPYWPSDCWVVADANHSHQAEVSGSVIFRF